MDNQKFDEKSVRALVRSYYDDNPNATEEMINHSSDKIVQKVIERNLSIEELKVILDGIAANKKKLDEIRHSYYKIVKHIEEVAESVGNVPIGVVEDLLLELDQDLGTVPHEQLIAIAIERFKTHRNMDVEVNHETPRIIEKVLNSDELKEILTSILSNQSTAGEHTALVLDGCYLSANLNRCNNVLSFITNYIIIHRDAYKIEKVYEKIKATNINSMSSDELNNFFTTLIAESVREKLDLTDTTVPENKIQIANYVYDNFIRNGYCFQGTNSRFRENIKERGLSTEFSRATNDDLVIVDRIFKKHGLEKIFYSKLSETEISPYYYTTESMNTAYFYSYHNPEYFAYFAASSNYMPDENYFRAAYYLRDRDSCRANVQRLCNQYHLSSDEQETVMGVFEKLSAELINDGPNTVTLVPRKLLNKHNVPIELSNITTRSIESTISEITKSRELTSGTKQHIPVPADKIDVIEVPPLRNFYDKTRINKADSSKFIPLKNGSRYYYDILIHADAIDYDCISIQEGIPSLTSVDSRDIKPNGYGKIDIISCPPDIEPDTLLSNGKVSFQSLQMMIAVNGKANSPEGEKLIAESRKSYSPQYMSDYYYHLCELLCRVAQEESIDPTKRSQAILRMAKDFYPKAELMRITGQYPELVNEDRHLHEYLSYYDLLQIEAVESIKNGNGNTVENDPFKHCIQLFQNKLKGKINPDFTAEFAKKTELYGITALIRNYENQEVSSLVKEQNENSIATPQDTNNELALMFETPAPTTLAEEKKTQNVVSDTPKVMKKTSAFPTNNGISTTLGIIMVIVATILIFLALTIII